MSTKYRPFKNFGPGDFIQDELEARGWTQEDLSEIIGMSTKSISHIVNHKQQITIDSAKKLAQVFGQSPQYWLKADANFRLRQENRKEETEKLAEINKKSLIYEHMPVKDMINLGWLKEFEDIKDLEHQVLNFWGKKRLNFSFLDNQPTPKFRKSTKYSQFNKYYALTWCQKAKNESKRISKLPVFDRKKAIKLADNICEFTYQYQAKIGVKKFLNSLNEVGIRFLVQAHLPKTYLDGAALKIGNNPTIIYTARYDRLDNFWFTVAHELGHLLLHLKSKDDVFLDDFSQDEIEESLEIQADKFARDKIKAPEIIAFFKKFGSNAYITKNRIHECSNYLSIHESIVVGVLQHEGLLDWSRHNEFKKSVKNLIPDKFFSN